METVTLKLVTIVGETVLEEKLTSMLREQGASGWTVTVSHGEGSRGIRAGDVPGEGVKIETIVHPTVADRILTAVAHDFFPHYAVIAWLTDVTVARGDKYV